MFHLKIYQWATLSYEARVRRADMSDCSVYCLLTCVMSTNLFNSSTTSERKINFTDMLFLDISHKAFGWGDKRDIFWLESDGNLSKFNKMTR